MKLVECDLGKTSACSSEVNEFTRKDGKSAKELEMPNSIFATLLFGHIPHPRVRKRKVAKVI